MTLAELKKKLEEDEKFASQVRRLMSPTKKKAGGGMAKKTKGYAKGGAMKKTKGYSKGGVARGTGAAVKGKKFTRSA